MPQRAARLSLLTSLQHQATTILAAVTKEIYQREHELAVLKAEAARWQRLLRKPLRESEPAVPATRRRAAKRRLDWTAIFKELPARFTVKDIAQKTSKPIAHSYTYVSRWMKEKKVRRGKDGYQKVSGMS